jgi:hypothetical protein
MLQHERELQDRPSVISEILFDTTVFSLNEGFRLHSSSPSCLISCMSGVRSWKAAAG